MQDELTAAYPNVSFQILGINEINHESGNVSITQGRDLPWLQDADQNGNRVSDVWYDNWDITFRDIIVLGPGNTVFSRYNLTTNSLATPANYATLKQMFLEAASPAAGLTLKLVERPTATTGTGEATQAPAGQNWLDEWGSFYIEIWADTPSSNQAGLAEVTLDLAFDSNHATAQHIEYGPAFTLDRAGTINNGTGRVSGLSARTSRTDVGDDGSVLFARIEFASHAVPQGGDGHYPTSAASVNFHIENPLVDSILARSQVASPAAINASLMPVIYDVNDDGTIGFGDFSIFASSFLQTVGATPQSWAVDFDHSGRVGFSDLSLFSANFLKSAAANDPILYPSGFPNNFGSFGASAAPPPAALRADRYFAAMTDKEEENSLCFEPLVDLLSLSAIEATSSAAGEEPAAPLANSPQLWEVEAVDSSGEVAEEPDDVAADPFDLLAGEVL